MATRPRLVAAASLLVSLIAGCSNDRFAPATRIDYPYTLGEIGPLRFVLTRAGDQLSIETECIGGDPFGSVQITLRSSQGNGTASAAPPAPRTCRADEPPIVRATVVRLDQVDPGSQVAIDVTMQDGLAQAQSFSRAFVADGANDLYPDGEVGPSSVNP